MSAEQKEIKRLQGFYSKGDELAIKGGSKDEVIILEEIRDNGYATIKVFDADKHGKPKNNTAKKEVIPAGDIQGRVESLW